MGTPMKTTKSIFEFKSYKDCLEHRLTLTRGQLSRAAEFVKCQPSFLSRVMKAEVHITPDQAYMLTKFWDLTASESEYFLTQVEFERASERAYQGHLKSKLESLRKDYENLEARLNKGSFDPSGDQSLYFSSWAWSAVHFLTSIPKYQMSAKIAARLGLPEDYVIYILQSLAKNGYVTQNRSAWKYNSGQFHLPKNSPFVVFYHNNWRAKAVIDAQNPASDGIHFTNVFTLSESDYQKIKDLILQVITEANTIGAPSNPEEAVAFTCDFFRI
jgi:hypothetical protein